jgi:AcrR family transcriptional regulator
MTHTRDNLRADAKLNRDRILEVARQAFAADADASLNSIAKRAGVGAGTLYRHFPTREALVIGVYRAEIDALVALALDLTARHPPLKAFELWCSRLAQYGRIKHAITDLIHAAITDSDYQETYWPMVRAIEHLLQACASSNDFREGVNPEDLLLLLGFLWRIKPGPDAEAQAERTISLAIAGLKNPRA